jgi:hypothetical protein
MESPVYRASVEFAQPIAKPYVLQLENVSLAELMAVPAARDIVFKHLPSLKMVVGSAMLKPHMGNMTVRSLDAFIKAPSPDAYTLIDEELSRLPPVSDASL